MNQNYNPHESGLNPGNFQLRSPGQQDYGTRNFGQETNPNNELREINEATQKVDVNSIPKNFFYVSISGTIESGTIQNEQYMQVKYSLESGNHWEKAYGQTAGISQKAATTSNLNKSCVWNFPFDVTYRSLNPSGWPQLVITIQSPDIFGRTVVRGYGSVFVPTQPGFHEREVYIFMPKTQSLLGYIAGLWNGKIAEYENPAKTIAQGEGREVTRVETVGKVKIKFNVSLKNFKHFGYNS